ncbi:type II toxin-antitoxin system HicB family antitoxin [Halovivax gelatinilyticus]|uniref:type II toxin-antitoxin system HicB family antitoxin n=1 Tax=Halovivax gelatinilyticus TaxID=2961597 RepID=UPI0020CA2E1E|nr:hypothetical protein [Halovivax gelatinilyticus]
MTDETGDDDAVEIEATITVTLEEGLWIAADDETGISSQGHEKAAALRNLAAALDTVEEGEDEGGDDWL